MAVAVETKIGQEGLSLALEATCRGKISQLIYALKEATEYSKTVLVKIAAVHDAAATVSGIAMAGTNGIVAPLASP